MDILHCLIFLFIHITDGQYEVTEKKYQWNNSSNVCRVATPTLILKDKVLVANTSSIINYNVWVAYVQKQIPFEYIGCTKKTNDLTQFGLKKNNPGLCYFKCNYSRIVGLYKNQNLKGSHRTSPYCNSTCTGQADTACGGKDDNNTKYISLYMPAEVVDKYNGTGNCLSFKRFDRTTFLWQNCEIALRVGCFNGKTVMLRKADSNSSWIDSSVECFTNNETPITYKNTRKYNSTDMSLKWTGVVRSNVIYTIDSNSTVTPYNYGFLAVKNDTYNLNFANQTQRKKILCDYGTMVTSSPPIEPKKSSPNSTNSSSPTAVPAEPSTSMTDSEDKKDKILIGVGSTLAALCIFIIGIAVIVCPMKRNVQTSQSKGGDGKPQSEINVDVVHDESAPSHIRHDLSDASPEYEAIDLVTSSNNEDHNVTKGITGHAADNCELQREENEEDDKIYDTTTPGNQTSSPDELNPYNILTHEESSEYDHIGIGNKHSRNAGTKLPNLKNVGKTTPPENVYDYLENDITESDSISNATVFRK